MGQTAALVRGLRGNSAACRRAAATAGVLLAALLVAAPAAVADPVVTTAPAPFQLMPHSALVGGTIDPAGTDTTAIVRWGVGTSTGNLPLIGETLSGSGPQDVNPQELTGLQPGATYSYQLVGQQGSTQFSGAKVTFVVPAAPTVVTADAPSAVGFNSAVAGGTIDPHGAATEWGVDYGTAAPEYTGSETGPPLSAGTPAGAVSVRLTGLEPGTTYHYRVFVLENGVEAWTGEDRTFTTRAPDDATDIARAMAVDPAQVVGAAWQSRPPSLVTGALFGDPLSGFPLDGAAFAGLTTGTADDLDAADQSALASGDAGGSPIEARGPGAQDISVLQVGLQVPGGANCLSFAFRFLSEEIPDAASPFDDAFVAELDESTWTTGASTITAPRNFAFGPGGRVVSVNGLGAAATTPAGAVGTRFDNGTAVLRASTPITPGAHTLFLSLFDQGDGIVDSAVLLDRLQFTNTPVGGCQGAVVDDSTPILTTAPGSGIGGVVTAAGGVLAASATSAPPPVLGKQVIGATTAGTVIVTPPGGKAAPLKAGSPIPLGSQVDARRGHVRITAASDTGDGRQSGEFYGGVFVITQDRRAPVTTVLRLSENVNLGSCGARASAAGKRRKKKPGKRFLWGDGKGRFRTTGQYGAATVRGTKWLVQDSCSGTLVKVERGVVEARDFGRHRTVSVRAGRSYLARP